MQVQNPYVIGIKKLICEERALRERALVLPKISNRIRILTHFALLNKKMKERHSI